MSKLLWFSCWALVLAAKADPALSGPMPAVPTGVDPTRSLPRAATRDLEPIYTPPPKYPAEALQSQAIGEVTVELTVSVDGSVSAARVVRTNLPRVFAREAVATVKRWRFQPIAVPVTTRRTIGFKPGT